jgi:hypothetical protein
MPLADYRDHCFIEAHEVVRTIEVIHQEGDVRGTYRIEILKAARGELPYFARYFAQAEPGAPWTPLDAPSVRRETDEEALDQAMASLNLAVSTPI